jgi:hypothetical protein
MANKRDDINRARITPYLFRKESKIQPLINISSTTGASKHTRMKLTSGNCRNASIVFLYSSALATNILSKSGSRRLSSNRKNKTEQPKANNIPFNDILLKKLTFI